MRKALGLALALSFLSIPALAETPDELGEKLIGAMEEMAGIVDKDKANCDQMGGDLSTFADKNAGLFAKGKEAEAKATPEQKEAWKKKYQKRAEAAGEKMKPGMMACYQNEKVKAAFGKMKMK
jgi:hypothetical protein